MSVTLPKRGAAHPGGDRRRGAAVTGKEAIVAVALRKRERSDTTTPLLIVTLAFGLGAAFVLGGLPALAGGMVSSGSHRVHDVGWGVFTGLVLAGGFFALVRRPGTKVAVLQQLAAAVVVFGICSALAEVVEPLTLILLVAVAVVWLLHPRRAELLAAGELKPLLALVALAALARALPYALGQAELQRLAGSADPHAEALHYGGMAVAALVVPVTGLVAALGAPGWRVPAWCAGLGALVLGAVSVLAPDHASSLGIPWGLAALAAGGAWLALAELVYARKRSS